MHSLKEFARSLQICLFPNFTILVDIAPLIFLVEIHPIYDFRNIITAYKTNIKWLRCFYKWFDFNYAWLILIFSIRIKSPGNAVKVIIEKSCYSAFLETTSPFSTSIILSSKFVVLFEKNGFRNLQKLFENVPCDICFRKYSLLTFLLRSKL